MDPIVQLKLILLHFKFIALFQGILRDMSKAWFYRYRALIGDLNNECKVEIQHVCDFISNPLK